MQLANYIIHNHCLSATRVTTLWLKQPICSQLHGMPKQGLSLYCLQRCLIVSVEKIVIIVKNSLLLETSLRNNRWESPIISHEAESLPPSAFSLSTQLLALVYTYSRYSLSSCLYPECCCQHNCHPLYNNHPLYNKCAVSHKHHLSSSP